MFHAEHDPTFVGEVRGSDFILAVLAVHPRQNVVEVHDGLSGSQQQFMVIPSGYVKIAIENGHRNSGFTH